MLKSGHVIQSASEIKQIVFCLCKSVVFIEVLKAGGIPRLRANHKS